MGALRHVRLHTWQEVAGGVVSDELALDVDPLVLQVLGHLLDAVPEAGELYHDALSALHDLVGPLQHDDLVVDRIPSIVDVDTDATVVHDGHFAILGLHCL